MKLNVAQLMKSPVGTTREYEVEERFDAVDEQRLTEPVRLRLHLTRINDGLLARGDVQTTVGTTCSRCAEAAEVALRFHFDERFRPTIDIATGHPLKADEEDDSDPVYNIDGSHQMDLDEVIRQGLVLEAPMHPLCGPDCQGLCPGCGANLNDGACGCESDAPSGPMAAMLKDLAPLLPRSRS